MVKLFLNFVLFLPDKFSFALLILQLLRGAGSSILEVLKLDLVSFVYIPVQPIFPVRAETEIKLGGTQCNIVMNQQKAITNLQLALQ